MLLEATNLQIAYGSAIAVWDASLSVDTGEIVSVIGPNGAGKSTLINSIAGLLRPKDGRLMFSGTNMTTVPSHEFCSHGIALIPEGRRLFVQMTVEENLEIGSYVRKARKHRLEHLEEIYTLFPVLREKRKQAAGQLSGGQQQMVAIGRALMTRPRLVLFDEPSLGLAPSVVDTMFDIISELRSRGLSVLLVEQNVLKALEIADRAYVLDDGRIAGCGHPKELSQQSHIRKAYLGL
ncbi:ABC transporter ATP-binding protein [Bradyrhizobium sp. SSUT18]|nr:ABC transporter ATP-binding protein [Bradyrhizobium sp. SSUT18]MDH2401824.1 ABC transporter ATP-binding protein [Bradyrhizobium sp. SSUT18]